MDLKDLKSAWAAYSSQEVNKHRLDKEAIQELLKTRTKSLVERIDRNIRIGMALLLLFIAYVIVDSLFLSDYVMKAMNRETIPYPQWLSPIDFLSTTLIVTTYLFFAIRYIKVKRSFTIDRQLKDLLEGIIETVKTYKRLFYLVVVIFLLNQIASFSAGFYQGIKFTADSVNGGFENLPTSKIIQIFGVGLLILIPLVLTTFFLLRWGFNKLYGKYLESLTNTLAELDESENAE